MVGLIQCCQAHPYSHFQLVRAVTASELERVDHHWKLELTEAEAVSVVIRVRATGPIQYVIVQAPIPFLLDVDISFFLFN